MKQHIQLLVGTIASGKSTYSTELAHLGFIVINDDSIVTAVHGGNYLLYDKKLKPLYKSIENHILTTAIALGKSVIIDRGTNLKVNSRKRWVGLASSLDVPIVAVTFPFETAAVHAGRRMISDSRGYSFEDWQTVASYHLNSYEPVNIYEEQFRELYTIRHFNDIQNGTVQQEILGDFNYAFSDN